jgi:hypothetical protein
MVGKVVLTETIMPGVISFTLGALLVCVGIQHARLVRDIIGSPREIAVALCIGLLTLATGNLAVAFAAGIVLERVIGRDPLILRSSGYSPR